MCFLVKTGSGATLESSACESGDSGAVAAVVDLCLGVELEFELPLSLSLSDDEEEETEWDVSGTFRHQM